MPGRRANDGPGTLTARPGALPKESRRRSSRRWRRARWRSAATASSRRCGCPGTATTRPPRRAASPPTSAAAADRHHRQRAADRTLAAVARPVEDTQRAARARPGGDERGRAAAVEPGGVGRAEAEEQVGGVADRHAYAVRSPAVDGD